jgi:hypothetical protein
VIAITVAITVAITKINKNKKIKDILIFQKGFTCFI